MKFNHYIWELYKKTDGAQIIEEFRNRNGYSDDIALMRKYCGYYASTTGEEKLLDAIEDLWCYYVSEYGEDIADIKAAETMYRWVMQPRPYKECILLVPCLSMSLSMAWPEFFIPYLFCCQFDELAGIADGFDIEIPKIPKRNDFEGRYMYYWEVCRTFYEFRKSHGLSPHELCAFLYDFAPRIVEQMQRTNEGCENPTQAWFIGGKTKESELHNDTIFWQAGEDVRAGDILVFYEKHPTSAVTSILRASTDGVADPLFYYYGYVWMTGRTEVPHISIDVLKEDFYFCSHPLVKKNMQGVNGYPLSGEDYKNITRLIGSGTGIPKLFVPDNKLTVELKTERDVELHLLEPFLKELGLTENTDYIRQLGIHAGRGHRIFPDYALFYSGKKDEESAQILIEAKYHMKNNREREEAFVQAKSYALLLQSRIIVLCDKHSLFVYSGEPFFSRSRYRVYHWSNMSSDDYTEIRSVFRRV